MTATFGRGIASSGSSDKVTARIICLRAGFERSKREREARKAK